MSNSYPYYIYRCNYCGTRTILRNDKYNPFYNFENDKEIAGIGVSEFDVGWTCPHCYERLINEKRNYSE